MGRLTGRQVNLLLELLIAGAVSTGLLSWWAGDRWNGWLTIGHTVCGLSILFVVPAKLRGPVRAGFKRKRRTRWVSSGFGLLVLATIVFGMIHSTGIWYGVGYWSALWTHQLLGFSVVPLFVWHLVTRPVRPNVADLDRRSFLRTGFIAVGAAGLYVGQRAIAGLVGLDGADRRRTGSYEVASFDPANMPWISWINDSRPADTSPEAWTLGVNGAVVSIESLWEMAQPVSAILDCTGGGFSEQRWTLCRCRPLSPNRPVRACGCCRPPGTTGTTRTTRSISSTWPSATAVNRCDPGTVHRCA